VYPSRYQQCCIVVANIVEAGDSATSTDANQANPTSQLSGVVNTGDPAEGNVPREVMTKSFLVYNDTEACRLAYLQSWSVDDVVHAGSIA
jgi:hypothetical protein